MIRDPGQRVLLLSLLALFIAACANEPQTARRTFFALGTVVEITVHEPPPEIDRILHAVEARLLAEEHHWRAWGDGELAAINARLAAGETVSLDAEMRDGIRRAMSLAEKSGGRFNPAIGRMIEAWGFNTTERETAPPPGEETLAKWLPPPNLSALEAAENDGWRSTDPRLWIDMGAFAKGLAVDAAIEELRSHGVDNAIVNAGGDLKVIGRHGDRDWRIGVRDPRGAGVLAAIDAAGEESVFTSGDYERFFEHDGVRYHHIIDPSTARPARGVTSVTVIHPDAALADAAATALFVAGPGEWPTVAAALGIDKAMLVLADGRIEMTPAMQSRVHFVDATPDVEVRTP